MTPFLKNMKFAYTLVAAIILLGISMSVAHASSAAEIDKDVDRALESLYASSATAKNLATISKGVLVFPHVIKAGLLVGGQYGKGALRINGQTVGYYNTVAASYGLQAGAQSFGYAMFLMAEEALDYLKKSDGWEVGVGPSVVVVDKGKARSLTTSTAKEDIYVFFFDQKGLMAGLGVQGSKISRITPDK